MIVISLKKGADLAAARQSIQGRFPGLEFERDFPSFCFVLATGVGKTRLIGAFIAYLYTAHRIRFLCSRPRPKCSINSISRQA